MVNEDGGQTEGLETKIVKFLDGMEDFGDTTAVTAVSIGQHHEIITKFGIVSKVPQAQKATKFALWVSEKLAANHESESRMKDVRHTQPVDIVIVSLALITSMSLFFLSISYRISSAAVPSPSPSHRLSRFFL